MRRFFGLAAMAAVIALACPATAATPIKGIIVKGGQNPKGNYTSPARPATNPNMPGDVDGDGAVEEHAVTQTKSGKTFSHGEWRTQHDAGTSTGGGVTQEHAINTKGTGSVGGRVASPNGTGTGGGTADAPKGRFGLVGFHYVNRTAATNGGGSGGGSTAGNGVTQEHAINTTGTNATKRTTGPNSSKAPNDPKHPSCVLKTRTKSNQCNE